MLNHKSTLVQLLGLSPEATDEEISNSADQACRVAARMQRDLSACGKAKAELENKHKELSTRHEALLNSVVERDLDTFKNVVGDERDSWKSDLLANREGTIKKLEGLSKRMGGAPAGKQPLYNAATAKTPAAVTASDREGDQASVRVRNRALELLRSKECSTFSLAWNRAAAEVVVS